MSSLPYDPQVLAVCARTLVAHAHELAGLGWAPATSSNFSVRLGERHVAITVSGRDKGRLSEADIIVVDMDGEPVAASGRPSAETRLHTQLYRCMDRVGCVLHTHSRVQTVASRLFAREGRICLEGYELLKAFAGTDTHETAVVIPIFANSQDMDVLAGQVQAALDSGPLRAYLIDGHGLYTWGRDMDEARRHLEACEFLLACELDLRRLQ